MSITRITATDICLDFRLRKPSLFDFVKTKSSSKDEFTFRAIDNISFEIKAGDKVGLIGKNGAGKSTLLKLLSGVLEPTDGELVSIGETFPLLNLSADIVSQASCLQNIKLTGLLRGFKGQDLDAYIETVKESADIDRFLLSPVSTLSTGMKTRFLISLIGELSPQILVMDEWIGTTDTSFIEQKENKFNRLISSADIFILATHNRELIRRMCNKIMFVDQGKLVYFGNVTEGYRQFNQMLGLGKYRDK
ncbi:MAG: ABC-type polysaccharide/polyol phosphate transport system ATPase subunit [Arenicella sp.]|jgi:ABC-type polysaccharide/polyol phosphate transport system ATPase subunit